MRQASILVGEHPSSGGKSCGGLLERCGRWIGGEASHSEREQIKVQRVPVIVRRPFAMTPVGNNLPLDLSNENPTTSLRTPFACLQLWQCLSADVQRQGLTEQMRIRTEIVREILLDMR